MSDIIRLLQEIRDGNPLAAEQLLPLVYDELRAIASRQLTRERPGHSLQPTALVHEAFLRLGVDQQYESRAHFLAAASQAMRRILIESARRKGRVRHGGLAEHQSIDLDDIAAPAPESELVALGEALERLAVERPRQARLVELRFFGGMTQAEAA